ncbi:MAG TPA: hypothetical protein VGN32_10260 [Ktedonobacterales bacterium]|jgi:hypothetical protein|nr:hypothetical protein [Ktedonobacterales bacterium]
MRCGVRQQGITEQLPPRKGKAKRGEEGGFPLRTIFREQLASYFALLDPCALKIRQSHGMTLPAHFHRRPRAWPRTHIIWREVLIDQ